MEIIFILLLALAMDASLGEPPGAIHPVVWIGKGISLLERSAPTQSKQAQLLYGIFMVLLTIAFFALPVYFLLFYVKQAGPIAYIIGSALLLKPTFSLKELRHSALAVKVLLSKDNLEDARAKMPALVSRETQNLEKPALVSATLESVAENICDSFVAPLFYFLLLGMPGAIAYRVANTWDAMIGYHGKYEYLGKFSAKLDDVLNFIPARISGLLLVLAAYVYRKDAGNAWRTMLRDHGRTESPNAGWSMSAAAGALRVRLEKAGCYCLGQTGNPLSPQLIVSGINLATIAAILWVLSCLILEGAYFAFIA